jgi:hypothetical protein
VSIPDLHDYISARFSDYCACDLEKRRGAYRINPPFEEWEAEFFMRGLKHELFYVRTSDGILVYDALGGETKKNFFNPGSSNTCREAVTQFAALTQLIQHYNYPIENIKAESVKKGDSPRYALDALIFDSHREELGSVRIGMEAKCTPSQIRKLMAQIEQCLLRGPHDRFEHGASERPDHAKYQGILTWQPAYFWVVCPTERATYSVQVDDETRFTFEAVDDIPKFTPSSP